MNNLKIEKHSSTTSFILLFVTLLVAVLFMLIFIHVFSKMEHDENTKEETTTTTEVITTISTSTTTKTDDYVISFSAPLKRIIDQYNVEGKYDFDVSYNGAEFKFFCAVYDQKNEACKEGSALMTLDDFTYTLYTFASSKYDYITRSNDYYIEVLENNVILTMNNPGNEPGVMKIYDRKGKNLKDISFALTGYLVNDSLVNKLYPNYISTNNELNFYVCSKNKVYYKTIDLGNKFKEIYSEQISDATCY